jgi:YVTN family beta-propeller protein
VPGSFRISIQNRSSSKAIASDAQILRCACVREATIRCCDQILSLSCEVASPVIYGHGPREYGPMPDEVRGVGAVGLNQHCRKGRRFMSPIKLSVLSIPALALLTLATPGLATPSWFSRPLLAQSVVTTIPVGAGPVGVAVNPWTDRVYVANEGSGNVSVIDGRTDALLTNVALPDAPGAISPFTVAVNPSTNRIYVVNHNSQTVSVIDGGTETFLTNIALPVSTLRGGAVNPNTNRIYATSRLGSTLSVINGSTDAFVTNIALQPTGEPFGVAVNVRTNRIYVADQDGVVVNNMPFSRVWVIDGDTDTFLDNILLPPTGHPLSVAVNPRTNRVYVTNGDGNSVSVVDGVTNTVIGTPILVGRGPFGVAVNPRLNRIYVTNSGSDTVSVIDGATNAVIGTPISVGRGPFGVAVNPRTNRIYVTNSGSNTVSVIQDGCRDRDRDDDSQQGHDERCDDS